MKVLFIGGSGTISSACAKECWRQGIDLWVLLRGTRDYRISHPDRIIHGDIKKDPASVARLLTNQKWDCVVDWVAFNEADIVRDFEFFRGKTKKYIFISTTSVYKKPLVSPIVNETAPIGNHILPYAEIKARAEQLLLQLFREEDFPAVIIRPGHVYADFVPITGFRGMGFGLMDRIMRGKPILVHGDGLGLWSAIYNEDFARFFVPLIGLQTIVGETIQITSDELLTWSQIYQFSARSIGREIELVTAPSNLINEFDREIGSTLLGDKAFSHVFDNSKLKRLVPHVESSLSFWEGVQRCALYYLENLNQISVNQALDKLMDQIIYHVHSKNIQESLRLVSDL